MTTGRTPSRNLKSTLGAAIFSLGLLLLFVNLDGAADQVGTMLGAQEGAPGLLASIGLAGLHAAQAYAFNHDAFLSALDRILVSFWPLSLIIAGVMLLGHVFAGSLAANGSELKNRTMGERQ